MSAPDSVQVRLRYPDLETFVERFGPNVTRGGVFLATRQPPPVGALVSFELQLQDGRPVLAGEGKVAWTRPYDPAQPRRPHGAGVQFTSLAPQARELVDRILRIKAAMQAARGAGPAHAGASIGPTDQGRNGHRAQAEGVPEPLPAGDSTDLARELGVDEAAVRRILDRHRGLAQAPGEEDLTELLRPDPVEPVSAAQAVAELPRLLDPGPRRRSGAMRTVEALIAADRLPPPVQPTHDEAMPGDGQTSRLVVDIGDDDKTVA